jgi:hypothetical protein
MSRQHYRDVAGGLILAIKSLAITANIVKLSELPRKI